MYLVLEVLVTGLVGCLSSSDDIWDEEVVDEESTAVAVAAAAAVLSLDELRVRCVFGVAAAAGVGRATDMDDLDLLAPARLGRPDDGDCFAAAAASSLALVCDSCWCMLVWRFLISSSGSSSLL